MVSRGIRQYNIIALLLDSVTFGLCESCGGTGVPVSVWSLNCRFKNSCVVSGPLTPNRKQGGLLREETAEQGVFERGNPRTRGF